MVSALNGIPAGAVQFGAEGGVFGEQFAVEIVQFGEAVPLADALVPFPLPFQRTLHPLAARVPVASDKPRQCNALENHEDQGDVVLDEEVPEVSHPLPAGISCASGT